MKVYCKKCGNELTGDVELYIGDSFCETDLEDFIVKGYYTISDGNYYTNTEGSIIINMEDLKNTLHHPDVNRHNGCCGLDGLDGTNRVCNCGTEVATIKSDCWMAHAVILEVGNTILK